MIKVGITGQSGFIGTHLFNYLGFKKDIKRIEFKDEFFKNEILLDNFVGKCDVIVHFAAVNRHNKKNEIYKINIELVNKLIASIDRTGTNPHILMSSSIQEYRDNEYGRSKKDGRDLFIKWAQKNDGKFTGLIIPNVFGPFGVPFYNSFIATFSHQIVNKEKPRIQEDTVIDLVYVQDLIEKIYYIIINNEYKNEYQIDHLASIRISEVLDILNNFNNDYVRNGIFPKLNSYLKLCLFNTFRSYLPDNYFPRYFNQHLDVRGKFLEIVKSKGGGQYSYSTTKPRVTRGNHFHLRKVERFAVIQGEALIKIRRIGTDKIICYKVNGNNPAYIDIPIWYAHNITNVGMDDLITLFWINEIYNPENSDTYYEKV